MCILGWRERAREVLCIRMDGEREIERCVYRMVGERDREGVGMDRRRER